MKYMLYREIGTAAYKQFHATGDNVGEIRR